MCYEPTEPNQNNSTQSDFEPNFFFVINENKNYNLSKKIDHLIAGEFKHIFKLKTSLQTTIITIIVMRL